MKWILDDLEVAIGLLTDEEYDDAEQLLRDLIRDICSTQSEED